MKKSIYVVATMAALLLAGCSNQAKKNNSSKNSVKSSKVTKKTTKKPKIKKPVQSSSSSSSKKTNDNTKMNFAEIQQGNYSSLMGNWRLVKAVAQHKDITQSADEALTVNQNQIATSEVTLTGAGLKADGKSNEIDFTKNGNSLIAQLKDPIANPNWSVSFFAAGANNLTIDGEKQTPPTKNTIVIWTSNNNYTLVFEEESAK